MVAHRVAVYGTLREGGSNHRLLSGCRFVERTVLRGTLLDLGGFPALLDPGDVPVPLLVTAEVYECNDQQLLALDFLEGYDENNLSSSMYRRKALDNGCWVYYWNGGRDDYPILKSGDWIEHVQKRYRLTSSED